MDKHLCLKEPTTRSVGVAKEGKMSKVDIDKLDTDNYAVWSVKMKAYLVIKDLWSTISGKGDVKPGADEKALAPLALHVKDFHLATLSKAESAKDAWETLESVYQAKSTARRLQLKRELNNLRKEPSEALTKYVSRATDLRDQLISAGHTIEDSEVVMSVLAGLPKEFDTVVAVLEITDDKLELDVVLAKLLQAEQRLTRGEKANKRAPSSPIRPPSKSTAWAGWAARALWTEWATRAEIRSAGTAASEDI